MEAQLAGFAPFEQRDLAIQAGLSVQLDFTMKIGDLAETIQVRDEAPLLETEKAMRTLHLEGDFLRALPLTPGHDWWDASTLAPGVLLRHGAADAIETHGAGVSSNVFLVDGIDVSDPQNTPFGTYLPPDAVEQTTITTSGHNVASRMAAGAQFAVVTRSGGNQTHGAVTIDLQPRSLNATNVPGGTPADRSIARPAASLGGAIVRDRLSYFGAYRYVRERSGLARTDDELVALRLFQPGFLPYDSYLRQHQSLTKVTFQTTTASQLVLSVQFDRTVGGNLGFPRWTRERAQGSRSLGPVYSGTWRRSIGRRASLEAQAGLSSKPSEFLPQGEGPSVRVYSSVVSSQGRQFGSGRLIVEMGNVPAVVRSPTQRRSNINSTLTYVPGAWRGSHELTLGLNLLPITDYASLNVSSNDGFVSEDRVLVDSSRPGGGNTNLSPPAPASRRTARPAEVVSRGWPLRAGQLASGSALGRQRGRPVRLGGSVRHMGRRGATLLADRPATWRHVSADQRRPDHRPWRGQPDPRCHQYVLRLLAGISATGHEGRV